MNIERRLLENGRSSVAPVSHAHSKRLTYDLDRQARHERSLVELVEAILVAVICCAFEVDRAAILIAVVRGASEIEFVQLLIDQG